MKSRLTLLLLAVLYISSSFTLALFAKDDSSDIVELLEMRLADAEQENARLAVFLKNDREELESLRAAVGVKLVSENEVKALKSQNEILRSELEQTDQDLLAALDEKIDLTKQAEEVKKDLKRLEKKRSSGKDASAEISELKAACKNFEDENRIVKEEADTLKSKLAEAESARDQALADFRKMFASEDGKPEELRSEVAELKAIQRQRKAAIDDLFKQLAVVKGTLKSKDDEIVALNDDLKAVQGSLDTKKKEVQSGIDQASRKQKSLAAIKSETQLLKTKLQEAEAEIAAKVSDLSREVVARQDTEAKLDRIMLTDEQRKRAMDDILTRMATSEKSNKEHAAKISDLDSALASTKAANESDLKEFEQRSRALTKKVEQLEMELAAVTVAKETLSAKLAGQDAAAQKDAARVVELAADLARATATDAQRKKTMDSLLLELSTLETARDSSNGGIAAQLVAANKEIVTLKASLRGRDDSASPDLTAELTRLKTENRELRQRFAAIQARAAASSSSEDGNDAAAALFKMERDDLQRAKAELAVEAQALRDRKVDVRSSDLFREMERVNVAMREKLVQLESERQRLAKSLKKMERRDERYDDDISHEKGLRQTAETASAESRVREVEYQELIERMMVQVPQLEKQVSELESEAHATAQVLMDREEDLQALRIELEKREHRLVKAERVAEVLENAREDVIHASDREKLDMHYNMAAVYARDGKFAAAEKEYLHALRLDPTDADVHYNLGILYDDELKSPSKAVVHYRRYLKLNPHGAEADQVRDWLMKLEMKMKR